MKKEIIVITCDDCGEQADYIKTITLNNGNFTVDTADGSKNYLNKNYDLCYDCLKKRFVDLFSHSNNDCRERIMRHLDVRKSK